MKMNRLTAPKKQTQFKANLETTPGQKVLLGGLGNLLIGKIGKYYYFFLDFSVKMGIIIFINGLTGVVSSASYVKLSCQEDRARIQ
jgi:hypothetical protein